MRYICMLPLYTVFQQVFCWRPYWTIQLPGNHLKKVKQLKVAMTKIHIPSGALAVSEGVSSKKIPIFRLLNDQEELMDKYPLL